jgi:integrase
VTRTTKDHNLSTPAARARLKPRDHVYWRSLGVGVRLGYRRHALGGRWVWSRYLGAGRYHAETIEGAADDFLRADGIGVLSYQQAIAAVRELASRPPPGPLTVAQAMQNYFDRLEQKGRSVDMDERRVERHVLPVLGDIPVDSLDRSTLDEWLANVAAGFDGAGPTRARKATANRTLTILKAALNQSYKDGLSASDRAWRSCERFAQVDAPRERFFTQNELTRLINATQGDFRTLVKAALLSGCRYSELTRLRVEDFNRDQGFVHVRESKSGRPRDIYLTAEGVSFFTSITVGRAGADLMLTKNGKAWAPTSQTVPMREAMKAARIEGGHFHLLRHAAASYWLMSGVSLTAVARNLGHADSKLTESTYIHLIGSHRRSEMQKVDLVFGTSEQSTVVPFAK